METNWWCKDKEEAFVFEEASKYLINKHIVVR